MQNYNTAYDRSYQGWKDVLNNDWQSYNATNQNYWNDKDYGMKQDQWNWQQIKDKNDENWKHTQYDYQKEQDAIKNGQWDKSFAYQQQQDAIANSLKASSGGSGGSGGSRRSSGGSSGGGLNKTQTKDKYSQVFDEAMNGGDSEKAKAMIYDDSQNIIDNLGYEYWKSLENKYWKWMADGYKQ
jgi:hypothetical protein